MTSTPAPEPTRIPRLGESWTLPTAGATPHTPPATDAPNPLYDRLIYGKTPADWAIRIVLTLVMTAALAVGTWSIYTLLTQQLQAPKPIAILGCGMFDVAALFFALLSQRYAVTTDSGLAPRLAMLAMVSTSSWVNWQHGQLEGWGIVGSVILAAAPAIAELAFEMFHRYAHRETLRRLGRVAQTLPVLGKWAWIAHPLRSHKTIDAHIRAALTEHEAVAERRVELAGDRARSIVSVPLPGPADLARTITVDRVDRPAIDFSRTVDHGPDIADHTGPHGPQETDQTTDRQTGPEARTTSVDRTENADRTARATGPDRREESVGRTDGPQQAAPQTDRGPDRARTTATDRAVRTADTGPDRTDTDLVLTDLEQQAIDILRSTGRSISKRSIAEVVRTELGGSIASDRAVQIARHFRILRSAA